ncbi:hypothetical protein [Streptomyces sp. NPDC090025]|uniref:hypothetical protein n=1 Tax=Streptomyces sp. NPDC090025 TaxID=3365922 RepID=UPI0038389FA0
MIRHALARRVSVTALGLAVGAGGLIPLAGPAAAAEQGPGTPQEFVVPAAVKKTQRTDSVPGLYGPEYGELDAVGTDGVFLNEDGGLDPVWIRYSDGKRFEIPGIRSAPGLSHGTGTDALAFVTENRVELRRTDGSVTTLTLPSGGLTGPKVYGERVVGRGADGRLHILSAGTGGTTADLTVDEPAGTALGTPVAGDGTTVVLQSAETAGKRVHTLVDTTTGKVLGALPAVPASITRVRLSPKHVLLYGDYTNKNVLVGARAALSAPLAEVQLPVYGDNAALVGDWIVHTSTYGKVQALPVTGGTPVDLFDGETRNGLRAGTDGSAIFVGGPDSADWAVRRITAGPGGKPVITTVLPLPGTPVAVERLAVGNGRLVVADHSDDASSHVKAWARKLSGSGPLTVGEREPEGKTLFEPCPADDLACQEYWATGDGGFLGRLGGDSGYVVAHSWDGSPYRTAYLGKDARVRDVAGSYLIHENKGGTRQSVVRLAEKAEDAVVVEERAPVAAALGNAVLWSASADKGLVTAKDLKTGKALESVDTGAPCVPNELQAAGNWLYWSCGAEGPAGVYDRIAKSSRTVPSGEALLGDGYVVTHDKAAGKLVLTGAAAEGPASRVVGDLPDTGTSQRRVRWNVDKYGGPLAFADAEQRVHVVTSGIPPRPLAVLDRQDTKDAVVDGITHQDKPQTLSVITGSRAFGAWTLTARHHTTGQVSELSSGTGDQILRPSWNGRDKNGTLLGNGRYTWTLTARPDGASGAPVTLSGEVRLHNGQSDAHTSFTSLPQQRVLDTRNGTGVRKGKIGAGQKVTLDLSGVPGIGTAWNRSVALHVTATNATSGTVVTGYGADTLTRPSASNLNVPAGKTVSNLMIVPIQDGKVTFYNHSGTVDLIADLSGVHKIGDTGSLYRPMTPWRALDTRSGLGAPKAQVKGGSRAHISFKGTAVGGADVTAVVLNVTATNVSGPTVVAALPKGGPVTGSHLNPLKGETRSNLVVVPVKDGGVDVYNHSGTVDLIADVAGYYTSDRTGSLYSEIPYGNRVLDTRNGTGAAKAKVGAGRTVTLKVGGTLGVPEKGVTAVVMNVTATNPTANTFVTAYPYGTTRTAASSLNVPAKGTVPNLVIVPVKDGKVTFYNHAGTVDLIADVQGFYAE